MPLALVTAVRVAGLASLAVWLAGVSGALDFGPTENWTALAIGLVLLGLLRLAGSD